jgi:hypothetical protein
MLSFSLKDNEATQYHVIMCETKIYKLQESNLEISPGACILCTYHIAFQPILPSKEKLDFLNREDHVEDYQAPVRNKLINFPFGTNMINNVHPYNIRKA